MGAQDFSEVITWGDVAVRYGAVKVDKPLDAQASHSFLTETVRREAAAERDYYTPDHANYDGSIGTTSLRNVYSTPVTLDDAYSLLIDLDGQGKGVEKYECDAVALVDSEGNHGGWVFAGIGAT